VGPGAVIGEEKLLRVKVVVQVVEGPLKVEVRRSELGMELEDPLRVDVDEEAAAPVEDVELVEQEVEEVEEVEEVVEVVDLD
jgi:hypothetical protein